MLIVFQLISKWKSSSRCNFLGANHANFSFLANSLRNSGWKFLKFFYFNRAAKNKGLKRSNELVKLLSNRKFREDRKINSLSLFLAFKVSSSFPSNQKPLTVKTGNLYRVAPFLKKEDVSVFCGFPAFWLARTRFVSKLCYKTNNSMLPSVSIYW